MAWTDDRMDDLARQMAAGFARTDHEIDTLRAEMREGFRDIRAEFKGDNAALRTELKGDIEALRADLRGDIGELRSLMMRFHITVVIGMFSLAAALIGTT